MERRYVINYTHTGTEMIKNMLMHEQCLARNDNKSLYTFSDSTTDVLILDAQTALQHGESCLLFISVGFFFHDVLCKLYNAGSCAHFSCALSKLYKYNAGSYGQCLFQRVF